MIKIAVIEDSKAIVSIYRSFLKDSEFDLHTFDSTVADINRLITEGDFSIIICPSYPKFQNGPEIVFNIRSEPKLSPAIFILSTTLQKENLESEWDLRDFDKIIVKPFQKKSLLQILYDAYQSSPHATRKTPIALVIDDSNAVRKTLSSFLRSLDFDVKTAADGKEGIALVSLTKPDLILVDVEMPVMNGFEFCKHLSDSPQSKNIPVVVISGTIDEVQFKKGFKSGAVDFLQKPVSQVELAEIVGSVLHRKKSHFATGTTVILSKDDTLSTILLKILNFMNTNINICSSLDDLETYLNVSIPEIIILDLSDQKDKLNLCQHVRNLVKSDSPVIVAIAEERDRDIMFQCFKFGATEFMTQPFGRDEVRARIENHIKLKRLQDELVRKNKILESLAFKDKLTGLMNRRFFDQTLKEELNNAEKNRTPLSFMMMDLDNFKRVNDQFGHDIGDLVLQEIARVILHNAPDNSVACRYGGEEFCIIFPETFLADAIKSGERIRRLCQMCFISEHKIQQTISAGISAYPETSLPGNLATDADHFLYKAKQAGKNRIVSNIMENVI